MEWGSKPRVTLGFLRHHPLQPHRVAPSMMSLRKPWLRGHCDTHQLHGTQVPSWQPCTLTAAAKIPPGSSCCLSHCCLHLCISRGICHLIKQILHLHHAGRAGGGGCVGGRGSSRGAQGRGADFVFLLPPACHLMPQMCNALFSKLVPPGGL